MAGVTLRPQRCLQLGGLVVIAFIAADVLLSFPRATPLSAPGSWGQRGVTLAACGLFAWAFWRNTGALASRVSRRAVGLLALQALIAALTSTDFFELIAAEVPFVLPGAAGLVWFLGQALLTMGIAAILAKAGTIVLSEGAHGLPGLPATLLTVATVLGWQLFAFFVGHLAASESRSRAELERLNAELRRAQGRLAETSRLSERLRISRELHDAVGHHLTLLTIHLQLAEQLAAGDAAATVREARSVARALLQDVRDTVSALREEPDLHLPEALRLLVAAFPEPRVELTIASGLPELPPQLARDLFRAAQELLTNAARHSRGQTVWLALEASGRAIELAVTDDGEGAAAFSPGHGLAGLRERVEAHGGSLVLENGAGRGFAARLRVPLPAGSGEEGG